MFVQFVVGGTTDVEWLLREQGNNTCWVVAKTAQEQQMLGNR